MFKNIIKIFYIVNARIPTEKAHGYQIGKMCEFFAEQTEVELIYPNRENIIKDDVFSFYNLKNNFKIRKIQSFDFFRYDRYFGRFSFWLQNIFFLLHLMLLKIPGKKNDLIIYTRTPAIAWLFATRGFRVVFESHNIPKRKIAFFKILAKRAYAVITVTEKIKNWYVENDFKKVLVSHDAVDLETFDINIAKEEARNIFNLPKDKIILGFTGSFKTMEMDKGVADILKALKIINNKEIKFVAIGGNQDHINFYQKMANDLGVGDNAIFLSKVDLKKLAIFQKACDILLMPFPWCEHYAYYMSPLKMFEYMASQRPIIASDLPSIREVLDEKNCLFCKPDNADDLAEKINFLVVKDSFGRSIAAEAYNKVKDYTWDKRAKNILNFINN